MKHIINTRKEYRLFCCYPHFIISHFNIAGSSVKNVIDSLLLEIEYQEKYAELGPDTVFGLVEYEVGEIPASTSDWMIKNDENIIVQNNYGIDAVSTISNILSSNEFNSTSSVKSRPVYFNKKLVEDPKNPGQLLDPNDLIKRHKGYKNMVRLWKEVEKERQRSVIKAREANIRIKKENDIILLASIMKRNKDFKKMIKEASSIKTGEDLQILFQ